MTDYFSRALRSEPQDDEPIQVQAPSSSASGGTQDYFSRALGAGDNGASSDPSAPTQRGGPGSKIDFDRPAAAVRADIAKLPTAQRGPTMKAWAEHYVAKEHSGGGIMRGASDYVRDLATGTPVGSWLNEGNAAIASGVHRITGGRAGAPYDEAMAYHEARDRASEKDSTVVGKIPLTNIDVNTGDLRKVAGGIASVPVAPVAHVFRGATMLPQMGNALLTGLGYGGLYGLGQGEGVNRLWEGGKGVAVGGTLGPLAVPAARGLGNSIGFVADRFRPMPQPLQQYERGAVNALARSSTDDALAPRYAQQASELGPEGMLADMGGNLRGQASALANQPGPSQQRIQRALNDRRDGAAGRISADVDQALGPAVNLPETLAATQQHHRQLAAPHRQTFQQSPVPFTQPLEDTLAILVNDPRVLNVAARYAAIDPAAGPQQFFARQMPGGGYQITRVPNAIEWDYIKRALDGLAQRPDVNDQRIYGALARRVRETVDDAISPGAPHDSAWARARAFEAEDFQLQDAVAAGRNAFNNSLTPDQMRAQMYGVGQPPRGGMNPPELDAYRIGARDQVRTIMGNASTAHGENAATAARKSLGSDFAREKLDMIAGPQAASGLTRRLDAETAFEQTRQAVVQNSATAQRQAAQAEFPNPVASRDIPKEIGTRSGAGMAAEFVYRFGNAIANGAIGERRMRVARDAAEMLIAQGQARDNIANAIFVYSQTRALSRTQRQSLVRLATTVAEGTRQKSVDYFHSEPHTLMLADTGMDRNALMPPPPR